MTLYDFFESFSMDSCSVLTIYDSINDCNILSLDDTDIDELVYHNFNSTIDDLIYLDLFKFKDRLVTFFNITSSGLIIYI